MNIITKFAIATDEATDVLFELTRELATEKFASILEARVIAAYINKHFDRKYLVSEMNSMSNQWLVVYADNLAVGYAKLTSIGKTPELLAEKRALRIADFSILEKFSAPEIQNSLFEKCLSLCKHVEGIWVNEYIGNPIITFFESKGFERLSGTFQFDDIALPSACLTYLKERTK